ncbi:hypothetical protein [Streptomyces olivaceus]|uniref:hypothetical protein n=1 Tax=Streptomyces olivaceus TaxID=47716 RepID=UPI0040559D08
MDAHALRRQEWTISAIARHLGRDRKTIRAYLNGEARRFRQLRGHLSYLKLNDAAAALNRVLDQARTERMSLTAALERLLEIEVEATEAHKLAARERVACLPEP